MTTSASSALIRDVEFCDVETVLTGAHALNQSAQVSAGLALCMDMFLVRLESEAPQSSTPQTLGHPGLGYATGLRRSGAEAALRRLRTSPIWNG